MEFNHYSVLLEECIENLNIKPDGVYVDGTLGGAGHSYQICQRLSEKGRLVGIDQDKDAICAASKRLEEFRDRVTIVRSNYSDMKQVLHELGIEKVDYGETVGWSGAQMFDIYRSAWIEFEHKKVIFDDGLECFIIHIPLPPIAGFEDY